MRFLPGSNREAEIRKHAPVKLAIGRPTLEKLARAVRTALSDADEKNVRRGIKRGDITVHDQRVVHGSGQGDGWRRAYVLAFRTTEMVDEERRLDYGTRTTTPSTGTRFHAWQTGVRGVNA